MILINGGFEDWTNGTSSAPDDWTLGGTGAAVAKEITIIKIESSAKITYGSAAASLSQSLSNYRDYTGKKMTFVCWVYASAANRGRIAITDGVGTTYSSYHSGSAGWEQLKITRTIDSAATELTVYCYNDGSGDVYLDNAVMVRADDYFYPIIDGWEIPSYDFISEMTHLQNNVILEIAGSSKHYMQQLGVLPTEISINSAALSQTDIDLFKKQLLKSAIRTLSIREDREYNISKVQLSDKIDTVYAGKLYPFSLLCRCADPFEYSIWERKRIKTITSNNQLWNADDSNQQIIAYGTANSVVAIKTKGMAGSSNIYDLLSSNPVSEPSFETVALWNYSEVDTNNVLSGSQSNVWSSVGTYSYKLSKEVGTMATAGDYCQISQSVNFDNVEVIKVDLNLTIGAYTRLNIKIDSTIIRSFYDWDDGTHTIELPVGDYTGSHNLVFQLEVESGNFNAATCYVDNILCYKKTTNKAVYVSISLDESLPEASNPILNPDFETTGGWTYAESSDLKNVLFGAYSTEWKSHGSQSYKLWCTGTGYYGDYANISQTINLSNISNIIYDINISVLDPYRTVKVYIDSTCVKTYTTTATLFSEVIDVSGYTGDHILKIQIENVDLDNYTTVYIDNFSVIGNIIPINVTRCCISNEILDTAIHQLNTDNTGTVLYNDDFTTSKYKHTAYSFQGITYQSATSKLDIANNGYIIYKFDVKYPLSAIPVLTATIDVTAGTPKIQISIDGSTWYDIAAIVDDVSTAYDLYNTASLSLKGKSLFYFRVVCDGSSTCSVKDISLFLDLQTVLAAMPEITANGQANTFRCDQDSNSGMLCLVELIYKDRYY